jgi:hypothetical protein
LHLLVNWAEVLSACFIDRDNFLNGTHSDSLGQTRT